jgi:predicted membrane protein
MGKTFLHDRCSDMLVYRGCIIYLFVYLLLLFFFLSFFVATVTTTTFIFTTHTKKENKKKLLNWVLASQSNNMGS